MSPIAPEACDLLIEAGWVVPVEPHGVVLEDHAVAVRDGAIVALLPVTEARRRFPACRVVVVTASIDVRAARLAGRGRESAADVAKRLEREGAPVPPGIDPVMIDNSFSLDAGIAAFVGALRTIASN